MDIKNLLQQIKNAFKPQEELQDEVVVKFLRILENARQEDLSCGEMYAHLDEFVEREVNSNDAKKIMPLVQEHIDMCRDCCDEYEALLNVLERSKE